MEREPPTPEEIFEELADKVASQIDREAPVAFANALSELVRYHKFLLDLNASYTPDGAPFSYAEVSGGGMLAPHHFWLRQYGRLFERAVSHLAEDDDFARELAYLPSKLLPREGEPELTPGIIEGILDLNSIIIHRTEDWLTRRTTLDTREGAASPRLVLAGSDRKAYENFLPTLVSSWESLLHVGPARGAWDDADGRTDEEVWLCYRTSWPMLWRHLQNTAYALALAVWNEDELGAELYREALVRWPGVSQFAMREWMSLRHPRLLFPGLLDLTWSEAKKRVEPLAYEYSPPTPGQIFRGVLHAAHNDVILLTAGLLLFWTANEKQSSNIGSRTAGALMRHEQDDADRLRSPGDELGIDSLLPDLMRQELAGEHYRNGTYGAALDYLVRTLDTMTERRVVPGRIFTPTTLNGRADLRVPMLSMLLSLITDRADVGVMSSIADLVADESVLPAGDGSLRAILRELGEYHTLLTEHFEEVSRGTSLFEPGHDFNDRKEQLVRYIDRARADIDRRRTERLKQSPVSSEKLEEIRAAIEKSLLTDEAIVPFFRNVATARAVPGIGTDRELIFSGMEKARLVIPPMLDPISDRDNRFASTTLQKAGEYAWHMFAEKPREVVEVSGRADEEKFWTEIAEFLPKVGDEPILLVSPTIGQALLKLLYAPPSPRPNIRVERREQRSRYYMVTVDGVDVANLDVPEDKAWLFSRNVLRQIAYSNIDEGRYVTVSYEPESDTMGSLHVRFRQSQEWRDLPIFEIRTTPESRSGTAE